MTLHTIASGSEGNCLLVSCGGCHVLLDAGISARRITAALAALGLTERDLDAILLTHAHHDHVAALGTWCKRHPTALYATAGTAAEVAAKCAAAQPYLRTLTPEVSFRVGAISITAFPTSHDAWGSVGYRLESEAGSMGLLTDSGYVTEPARHILTGVDLLVLESNHDADWLRAGPYPYYLKERIAGPRGHLSNDDAARFAAEMALHGTKEIVLAHLSRENNTPQRALDTVQRSLSAAGCALRLTAAPRCDICRYEVEGSPCRK